MRLPLNQIRTDGGTNARKQLDLPTVEEYADSMQEGRSFPPIIVFFDGTSYWLADGFHRVAAASRSGFREISVELKLGTPRDAMLYAVGANATHGLKRTPADKRHAVELLLKDNEWGKWSDRAIAKATNTSHPLVAKVRARLTGNISSERTYTTKHGTTATMNVSRIGSSGFHIEQTGDNPPGSSVEEIQNPKSSSGAARSAIPDRDGGGWLGLDPGLATLRWALLRASSDGHPIVVDYGEIRTLSGRSTAERLCELEQDLLTLLEQFRPSHVAIEIPRSHPDYPPQTKTIEAIGVIELVCYRQLRTAPLRLSPQDWKSYFGDRRSDADEINDSIALTFDISSRARLDAIGIAYSAFLESGGEPK